MLFGINFSFVNRIQKVGESYGFSPTIRGANHTILRQIW
jgi:hypothetical protein